MIMEDKEKKIPFEPVIDEFGPGIRGRRAYKSPWDEIMKLGEGEYWKDEDGNWWLWPFGGETFIPAGTVTEHEDGTITVDREMNPRKCDPGDERSKLRPGVTVWRGYIRRGVWYASI